MGGGDVSEHDHRVDRAAHEARRLLGERLRPGVSPRASAGGDDHDRAPGLARSEHASELEEPWRCPTAAPAPPVGWSRGGRAARSAPPCLSRPARHHRLQFAFGVNGVAAEVGDVHREPPAGGAPEPFDGVRHPLGERVVAAAPRRAVREFRREVLRFFVRPLPFEGVGGERGGERPGTGGERERHHRERHQHRNEGRTV